MGDVGAPELLIILVVVLLVFGGAKLPELARSLGKAKKEFQKGVDEGMPGPGDDHRVDASAIDAIGAPTASIADPVLEHPNASAVPIGDDDHTAT